jgi:hypothetical protein
VDPTRDLAHCGNCGRACAPTQACELGVCVAPSAGCNEVCSGGRSCVAGACQCPTGQAFCRDACIDVQTESQHCGACEQACPAGALCESGNCACPNGQTLCAQECVDALTSLEHCGACGVACAQGETCMMGQCESAAGEDGCAGSARGVRLSQIAAYQSIKIPVMSDGASIDDAGRVADLIAGRQTVLRVFVTLATGFAPRELSARLLLRDASGERAYFARQLVSKSSVDTDTSSTFQLFVPAEQLAEDTSYSIELVECGGASGTAVVQAPRFPATGEAPLGAIDTGTLKVSLVPVQTNGRLPDTSPAALEVYRAYLLAMYPVRDVELTTTSQITASYPLQWTSVLDQIRVKREADRVPADVYYYGLVRPVDSIETYCRNGCTAGIGYVGTTSQAGTRAAVGLAYADETSAATMAHELGHNHGREHAPCAPGGNISGVDRAYPYAGAALGVWGYDSRTRTLLEPTRTTDIMGYCSRQWVSDYTYRGLIERVGRVNQAFRIFADTALLSRYHVMLIEGSQARWSVPMSEPSEPFGEPEPAQILDESGTVIEEITVYRTRIGDVDASTVLVPEPEAHWAFVHVAGSEPLAF